MKNVLYYSILVPRWMCACAHVPMRSCALISAGNQHYFFFVVWINLTCIVFIYLLKWMGFICSFFFSVFPQIVDGKKWRKVAGKQQTAQRIVQWIELLLAEERKKKKKTQNYSLCCLPGFCYNSKNYNRSMVAIITVTDCTMWNCEMCKHLVHLVHHTRSWSLNICSGAQ